MLELDSPFKSGTEHIVLTPTCRVYISRKSRLCSYSRLSSSFANDNLLYLINLLR